MHPSRLCERIGPASSAHYCRDDSSGRDSSARKRCPSVSGSRGFFGAGDDAVAHGRREQGCLRVPGQDVGDDTPRGGDENRRTVTRALSVDSLLVLMLRVRLFVSGRGMRMPDICIDGGCLNCRRRMKARRYVGVGELGNHDYKAQESCCQQLSHRLRK